MVPKKKKIAHLPGFCRPDFVLHFNKTFSLLDGLCFVNFALFFGKFKNSRNSFLFFFFVYDRVSLPPFGYLLSEKGSLSD